MVLTFPLLDEAEVLRARRLLDGAPWSDGRCSAGRQARQVKRNLQLSTDCEAARALQSVVLQALDRSPRFLAAALPKRVLPPRFNRYAGDFNAYGPHVDNAVQFGDGGLRVRTDLSCTVFLADPNEYEGGELVMHWPGGEQSVKLPAGQCVLYPGTTVHEVRPVTRGARLASFFWVESLVRSAEQRRLLVELDDALTALRNRLGETDEAVALTGTYHNLLRMWADT